jgi:microcystin degradation protein MlrC
VGIDPERSRMIVAKGAIAWKAGFGRYAARALYCRTPGYCPADVHELPYTARPRPLFPLDPETTWAAEDAP